MWDWSPVLRKIVKNVKQLQDPETESYNELTMCGVREKGPHSIILELLPGPHS